MAITDKLSAIADAIRAKTGESGTMKLEQMPGKIAGISTGITPSGNINITDTQQTDVTNYATAQVVDANLTAENIAAGVTVLGIVGTHQGGGGELPQLHAPTISINGRILTITNSTENGSFANGYKVLSGGAVIAETSEIQVDLFTTSIAHTTAQVSVVAKGTKFNDSDQSAPETYTAHYTVSEYDGETLLNTEVVKSGTMPSYTPKKSGYVFVEWKDVNGKKVTSITENISIYATWKQANTIKAGDYVAKIGEHFPAYAGYVNVWYDLGTFDARKTNSATNPTGTIDSHLNYTGLTRIQFYESGSSRYIYSITSNASAYVPLASFNDRKVISRVEYGIRFNSDQQVDNTQYNLFSQYFKKI